MSKQIDFTKPLSDENKAWLNSHAQEWRVEENERLFGPSDPVKPVETKVVPFPGAPVVSDEVTKEVDLLDDPTGKFDLSEFSNDVVKDVSSLTVEELHENLRDFGAKLAGKKHELQWRLAKCVTLSEAQDKSQGN